MKCLPLAPTGSLLFAGAGAKASKNNAVKLNLVSLMDIFTILVFFLMVNTGDVEVLQPDERIVLPKSYATLKPDSVPVVKVTSDHVQFNDNRFAHAEFDAPAAVIEVLLEALQAYQRDVQSGVDTAENPPAISIMADAAVPYALLKKVLHTSAEAGYVDVALAVEHTVRGAAEKRTSDAVGVSDAGRATTNS